jgi:hypothetical protein
MYLSGLSDLGGPQGVEATGEFQKIVDRKGAN